MNAREYLNAAEDAMDKASLRAMSVEDLGRVALYAYMASVAHKIESEPNLFEGAEEGPKDEDEPEPEKREGRDPVTLYRVYLRRDNRSMVAILDGICRESVVPRGGPNTAIEIVRQLNPHPEDAETEHSVDATETLKMLISTPEQRDAQEEKDAPKSAAETLKEKREAFQQSLAETKALRQEWMQALSDVRKQRIDPMVDDDDSNDADWSLQDETDWSGWGGH